jgi:serine/threonine-protein kinase
MVDQDIKYWQQANEIYADLTDMSVSEAIAELHQLPHINDQVKSLVLSLISAGQQSSHYFDQALEGYRHVMKQGHFEVGQEVGDYRLTQSLDQGGTADVFAAEKIGSDVQKPVAIKLFNHPGYLSHLSDRFQIEQKVLAGLSHPNIVKLYHGGHSLDGIPYMVMELVEKAKTIDSYVFEQGCSSRAIIRLMIKAARAVAYAHTNLVVHRDIKPSNILIDSQGTLKVVDFGIAKLLNQPKDPQKTTLLALTPTYAAPEQIKSEPISVRTDVFSLAAVCLHLITGETPLSKDRLLTACQNDDSHVHKLLKSAVKDSDLRKILYQALQSDPNRRYRHMDLFADDLQAWLERRPVSASRDSFFYRIGKFAQRRTALFVTSLALMLFALSSIVVFSWQYQKTRAEATKAVVVKDFMLKVFSYADPSQQLAENLTALNLLAMAETEALNRDWSDSYTQADILAAIGSAYANLGQWQRAENLISQAIKLNPNLISGQLVLITIKLNQSQTEQADVIFQRLGHDFEQEFSHSPELVAEWYMLKSLRTTFDNDYETGLYYIEKAFKLYQQNNHVGGQLKTARIWAEKLHAQSQSEQALQLVRETLANLYNRVSAVNMNLLQLQTTEIYLYTSLGDYQQSLGQANIIISNIKELLGEAHPIFIDALVQRAKIYQNLGQISLALQDAQNSLELAESLYGEESQMSQQTLSILLQLNYAMGNRDKALEQLKRVVAMSIKNYGPDNRMTLEAQIELANYLGASGQFDEAIVLAEKTLEQSRSSLGPGHYQTIMMNNIFLKLLSGGGRVTNEIVQQAVDNNQNALEHLGKSHPQTAFSYFVLGGVYAAAEEYEEANKAFIGLLKNNIITADNPRYIALTQAIAQNYKAAGRSEKAFEYAQKGWQAADKMMGSEATRTLQLQMVMLELMDQDNPQYVGHIKALRKIVEDQVIEDEIMLKKLSSWLQNKQP